MILHLARHGRSMGVGLFLGQSDPELSEAGREQSEALAQSLADARLTRIVCSQLRRSVQTAEIVGERLGVAVERDRRWNELRYGEWDGLSWDEIERRWPLEAQRKLADWWSVTPVGAESRENFAARVRAAWDDLRAEGGTALLVGHAGVNGLVAELCTGRGEVDWDRVTRFEQGYGEARRLEAL